jgi:hypothetical protein
MRLFTFSALTVLAGSLALAADGPRGFTYLSGNVSELSPNSSGTLSYSDGKKIQLRTPQHALAIPYAAITSVDLGEVHSPAPDPIYKVWSLHKRLSTKGDTQEMTVAFKDDAGREQVVTLELARQDLADVLSAIHEQNAHIESGFTSSTRDDWWGDQLWRTARNGDQWVQK